ncbi:MAG: ferrous iron transporter B [Akkermansiaceae bacterium]|jgi:ferrous iron transport protein B|nr:ferrous iron transporter B [Akkermansiaceae bacterium]
MEKGIETVMLVGHPNVGKTTLFNALTGRNAQVGNVAGVTVDLKTGHTRTPHGRKVTVIDLPGCYDLHGSSPDQEVTRRALTGEMPGIDAPDLAVCVIDATAIERQLPLALEVIERGLPVVVVLNMIDAAEQSGLRLDPVKLAEELKVPVLPMQARSGRGIIPFKQVLARPLPPPSTDFPWQSGSLESRQAFAMEISNSVVRRPDEATLNRTDRIDAVLLHPVFGWVSFVGIMFLVFWSIFSLAEVPMGWIEAAQGGISSAIEASMPEGDLRDLIIDGIIGGVGSVVIFLPQILLLFFFIGLLESSGYLARAAFLMDGAMSRVGLSGKAFLPLLSSYACAIPGIMATRTIDSPKERLVTIFVAPWMSCTARLPVYMLLIPMLMASGEGTWKMAATLVGVYAIGTLSAFIVARILRGKLGPDEAPSHFFLELPPYRTPQWSYIFRHLFDRGWAFVRKAGTIILAISIILWALSTYPKSASEDPAEQLAHSAIGRISAAIEPVVRPLGFDGRTGTAVLTSFAAREVFNSSMFQLFHIEEDADDEVGSRERLRNQLASETWEDGTPMFRPLAVLSILLFYIYALQCLPTSAVVAREAGSWKWAAGQFAVMSFTAFLASLIVYQVGTALGF